MNKKTVNAIGCVIAICITTGTTPAIAEPEHKIYSQTLQISSGDLLTNISAFQRLRSVKIVEIKPELNPAKRKFMFSPTQLKNILQKAGFKGDALKTAWAVAMKESTGRPYSLNSSSNCYGLFQINMTGSMGTDRLKKYGLKSNRDLFNPLTNAKIAFHMSNGGKDWSAWSHGMSKVANLKLQFPD
jgi:hypothetical protein